MYAYPAANLDEERAQHITSLRFHGILAEHAGNPLLGFIGDFMVNLLSDLTVYRRLYSPPNIELWQQRFDHQRALVHALRDGDGDIARAIMADHMETAWKLMRQQEVEMQSRFISGVSCGSSFYLGSITKEKIHPSILGYETFIESVYRARIHYFELTMRLTVE